jgi:8-oxo-dGTP pyrophosphatase MutT (NUDIX family)
VIKSRMRRGTKIQDNLYYDERSAGGIVYRVDEGKRQWLVIKTISGKSSKRDKPVYKFPKGHLQKGEFLKQAALREVEEEGQVKAQILSKIGSNNYIIWDKLRKRKIIKKVTFFLMEYLGQSNLKYFDKEIVLERSWMSFEEASSNLEYDSEKILLRKAKQRLDGILKREKNTRG